MLICKMVCMNSKLNISNIFLTLHCPLNNLIYGFFSMFYFLFLHSQLYFLMFLKMVLGYVNIQQKKNNIFLG